MPTLVWEQDRTEWTGSGTTRGKVFLLVGSSCAIASKGEKKRKNLQFLQDPNKKKGAKKRDLGRGGRLSLQLTVCVKAWARAQTQPAHDKKLPQRRESEADQAKKVKQRQASASLGPKRGTSGKVNNERENCQEHCGEIKWATIKDTGGSRTKREIARD